MDTTMPVFQKFRTEAEIIGRLVIGYGELELDLCNCVAKGISDFNKTVRAMFGQQGGGPRITIADNLGRSAYEALGLVDGFEEAIAGMRYCVRVRNQYAHRNFYDAYSGKLAFTNLEEIKKIQEPIKDLTWTTIKHVTPPLLEQQERYFLYVRDTIRYLNYEGRMRAKKLKSNPFDPPEKVTEPPLALDVDD